MCYGVPAVPNSTDKLWSVGIAESRDLQSWRKVGEMLPAPAPRAKLSAAPGAIVIRGQVHLFYRTYGNGRQDPSLPRRL